MFERKFGPIISRTATLFSPFKVNRASRKITHFRFLALPPPLKDSVTRHPHLHNNAPIYTLCEHCVLQHTSSIVCANQTNWTSTKSNVVRALVAKKNILLLWDSHAFLLCIFTMVIQSVSWKALKSFPIMIEKHKLAGLIIDGPESMNELVIGRHSNCANFIHSSFRLMCNPHYKFIWIS